MRKSEREARREARSVNVYANEVADRTMAFERAQVKEVTEDGRLKVWHNGNEIIVPYISRDHLAKGIWVTLARVDGVLQYGGESAYGGGAAPE